MKTYSAKPTEVTREWLQIDASSAPLGRIATQIAKYLTGKHKPIYTAHIDCGDYVVVVNAQNLVVTGNKLEAKTYYRYSGYPSGLTETKLRHQIEKDPTKVIQDAVKGMLPKNKLQPERMKRLKVYIGEEHGHIAQKPRKIEVK